MRSSLLIGLLIVAPALSADSSSGNYRMIAPVAVSVAARASSPLHRADLAGGSGGAVGIAASPGASTVSGPLSAELPTERIFVSGLED